MKIAIASGKGGTGKTTVSTNLARVLSTDHRVQYMDCDVEEPNGHLFLRPGMYSSEAVELPVPQIDETLCTHCGVCARFCRFHAIACLGQVTLTFPELCHACGGCAMVCPSGAITETGRQIGVVERGSSGDIDFVHGRLDVGEAMSPPLIRAVTACAHPGAIVVMDAPPGASCPVVATLRAADKAVMVAEPTAFGLHDLTLAVDMIRDLQVEFGVFINRSDIGDDRVEKFCSEQGIPIWGRLPHNRAIAEAYSKGVAAVEAVPEVRVHFEMLANHLLEEAKTCAR